MQGFTQQSQMHPGAQAAMTRGTGGGHQPLAKPKPARVPGQKAPTQQGALQGVSQRVPQMTRAGSAPTLSPLSMALLAAFMRGGR